MPEADGSIEAFAADPFAPARREEQFLRLAIDGPSGSGKTFTSLIAATTIARWEQERGNPGKIAVIDTERGSAALYADEFEFNHVTLVPPFSPARYVALIRAAADWGYDVLDIDSLSHGWFAEGGVLDLVDNAKARFGGNRFAGWQEGTPAQNALIQAIIGYPGHVISTMRSVQEWILEEQAGGSKVPRRIGMKPVQRDGVEYEFTFVIDMDLAHKAVVSKSRARVIADRVIQQPGPRFFQDVVDWLGDGTPMSTPLQRERIVEQRTALDMEGRAHMRAFVTERRLRMEHLSREEAQWLIDEADSLVAAEPEVEPAPAPEVPDPDVDATPPSTTETPAAGVLDPGAAATPSSPPTEAPPPPDAGEPPAPGMDDEAPASNGDGKAAARSGRSRRRSAT